LCELVERLIYEKGLHRYSDWVDLQEEIIRKSSNVPEGTEIEEHLKDTLDERHRQGLSDKLK
jgi:hypothetical protein